MARVPSGLWPNLLAVQVYGANTGVGKTVFSTLLGAHFARKSGLTKWDVHYIKPVSTGPLDEADEVYVRRHTQAAVTTLFQYQDPVSPHVAARGQKLIPSNSILNKRLAAKLKKDAARTTGKKMGLTIVETAGGVLSPGPSGVPQADIFRPLRLPAVLVGDHRLGGIASTISAVESLLLRGYEVNAVICFDDQGKYENAAYLHGYFSKLAINTYTLPWIPNLENSTAQEESDLMTEYYQTQCKSEGMKEVGNCIINRHAQRLHAMETMADRTRKSIWHPFTQHKSVENSDDILVFDSAYGDYFQTKHKPASSASLLSPSGTSLLYPAFDGSASWWTQGLGHGNPMLSLATAYAAGRYGHVMFAGATHEPALKLAERLLAGLQNPRLTKCFFTDDGSTAVEVGIKMALRASCKRYDWDGSTSDIGVLGLKGSYHGDTIGAMDASEPCVYNKKVDWYRGRGYWFDFPSVKMKKGKWVIESPLGLEEEFGPAQFFDSLDDIFDFNARGPSQHYETYIERVLDRLVREQGKKFGALVMEPIILGAGGMIFVDPLFQRSLVSVVRRYSFAETSFVPDDEHSWTGLPVIFDEVFTGLYRLGRFSAAYFLETHPDISIHAKLLTGGLLPLSVTLASDSIFTAFWGDEKADALLHGHSYTAHPIGCHVANKTLEFMKEHVKGKSWSKYRYNWKKHGNTVYSNSRESTTEITEPLGAEFAEPMEGTGEELPESSSPEPTAHKVKTWSMWSPEFVKDLSNKPAVDGVIAIGSVLAVSLVDRTGSGYTSNAATGIRDALLYGASEKETCVHSRVLGNVLYLMASMTTTASDLQKVEKAFIRKLDSLATG